MSPSFRPQLPGSFPCSRSATPSPQKQPAQKPVDVDMPAVPRLAIPEEIHMDQQDMAIPAATHIDHEGVAIPAERQMDLGSISGADEPAMAIPAQAQTDNHTTSSKHKLPRNTSFGDCLETLVVDDSDSSNNSNVQPQGFHMPERRLTALPSMDNSPQMQRASMDSGIALDLEKSLSAPPKRLSWFRKDKRASMEVSERGSTEPIASHETAASTSKSRRVVTSVGGGLRALKLMNRSAVIIERAASSSNLLGSKSASLSFGAVTRKCESSMESPSAPRDGLGEFTKPSWLEFPLPPGAQVGSPGHMRITAALEQQDLRGESIEFALDEEDSPALDPSDPTSSSSSLPMRKPRRSMHNESFGASSPDSMTTVIRHPRRRPPKEISRRSSSAETVVRAPLSTTGAGAEKGTAHEPAEYAASSLSLQSPVLGEGSLRTRPRGVSAQMLPRYTPSPSAEPRQRPQASRLSARRTSIPARLPLSPAFLGQRVHASGPSASSSPAAPSPAGILVERRRVSSNNADLRKARRESRNFSRPFSIAGHEAAAHYEASEETGSEGGTIGLAVSRGVSPVEPLHHPQLVSFGEESAVTLLEEPSDWPLCPPASRAPLEKPLPALPEQE